MIKSATLPYKNTLPEVNFKTNGVRSTKWNYLKEQSFVTNYFDFLKNLMPL